MLNMAKGWSIIICEFAQERYSNGKSFRIQIGSKGNNSNVLTTVTLSGVFKRRQNCREDAKSKAECHLRCQTEIFERTCNCRPFSLRLVNRKPEADNDDDQDDTLALPYCTGKTYLACWNETVKQMLVAGRECYKACDRLCTQHVYVWTFNDLARLNNNLMSIRFHASSFSYPLFEELPKVTLTDLVAQIGGVAGLYLGIDGLVVCLALIAASKTIAGFTRIDGVSRKDQIRKAFAALISGAVELTGNVDVKSEEEQSEKRIECNCRCADKLSDRLREFEEQFVAEFRNHCPVCTSKCSAKC